MKRLTDAARAHFARRADYEVKRRRERPRARPQLRRLTVHFDGWLDLIDNPEPTRQQLRRLDSITSDRSRDRIALFVDLSAVTFIDPCALLHLAAQLERLGGSDRFVVRGNYPNSEVARKALRDARFEQFMGAPVRLGRVAADATPDIELRRGTRGTGLRPRDWTPLHAFLKKHGQLDDEAADAFYNAFGECMENIFQHAFRGASGRWYGLAIRPTDRPARAVILDLGVGIPKSIRKTPSDKVRSAFAHSIGIMLKLFALDDANEDDDEEASAWEALLGRLTADDWACVALASQGKRTETGEVKRGKGLNGLRRVVLESGRGALHVLSGRAALTWRADAPPAPANLTPLRGTIVCLELEAGQREADGAER